MKCVSIFPSTFVLTISHFNKYLGRFHHRRKQAFTYRYGYLCHNLMEFEFSPHISERSSVLKFRKNFSRLEQSCSVWNRQTNGLRTPLKKFSPHISERSSVLEFHKNFSRLEQSCSVCNRQSNGLRTPLKTQTHIQFQRLKKPPPQNGSVYLFKIF